MAPRVHCYCRGPSFGPSTPVGQRTTPCNSSFRGSNTLFWTPRHLHLHMCILHRHAYTHNLKKKVGCQAWWPVILVLGRQSLEDEEFKASLNCIEV